MDIYEEMKVAVLEGDEELSAEWARRVLDEGMDLEKALNLGFLAGIQEAGRLYEAEEYFLPDLICAADAMKAALEILDAAMRSTQSGKKEKGKFAMVTVQGDVHDIGKTIVCAMMTASGYEVYDWGADVPNEEVVRRVAELKPEILALSALLTTTMEEQRNIIDQLGKSGLRGDVKVIIGGAPVSQEWADRIGADGYSDNAVSAVKLVHTLLA